MALARSWALAKVVAQIRIPMYPQILNPQRGDILVGWIRNERARNFALFTIQAPIAVSLEGFVFRLDERLLRAVEKWRLATGVAPNIVNMVSTTYNAFDGHRLGDPEPWSNGLVFPLGLRESFHPNCRGDISIATLVLQNLGHPVPVGEWLC